jgi:glycerol-3-phosphate acyltransferase PlsX
MNKIIKIAVDAMGGDNSPKKILDGIIHHYKKNVNTFYQIFGNEKKIKTFIKIVRPHLYSRK